MNTNSNRSVLNKKMVDLIKQTRLYLNHGPNHEKYALCLTIKNRLDKIYGLLVECEKKYHKKTTLRDLDIEHEKLRMDILLYWELGYFSFKNNKGELPWDKDYRRFEVINEMVDEVGAMIGGWIKKNNQKENNDK